MSNFIKKLKSEEANSMVENVIILPLIFIILYAIILTCFIIHDRATLDGAAKRGALYAAHCISDPNYDDILRNSLMGKSVTTAIALGITSEMNGIQGVTVIGVVVAGIMGPVVGPTVLKLIKVKNPIAFGLGMGSASHAIGTSKALEIGEVQGAMSSLAIVVTGILTVIFVPIVIGFVG